MQYNGTVICAHCNCMAGAGEACSHVAALLYAVMAKVNFNKETACTSVRCSWLQPSHNAQVKCVCGFKLVNSGLKIHTSYPHLGASPDGDITWT